MAGSFRREGQPVRGGFVAGGPQAERSGRGSVQAAQRVGVCDMGKGLILWLLGVPGIVVILLLVTHII
jgi:hypothetical protein